MMFSVEIILYILCSLISLFIVVRALAFYLPVFAFLRQAREWEEIVVQWIFLAPPIVFISILLFSGNRVSYGSDWFVYFLYHQVVLDSMRDGELLQWASSIAGGFPFAGHPEQPGVSPTILPVFLFGVVFGIKVNIAIIYVITVMGTFLFAKKYLRLGDISSAVISSLVISSTMLAARIFSQRYDTVFNLLMPAIVFLYLECLYGERDDRGFFRGNQRFWALGGASILTAQMLNQSKFQAITCLLIIAVISLYAFIRSKKKMRIVMISASMAAFTFAFAAPKILPMLELLERDARYVADWGNLANHSYSLESLAMALLSYKYEEIAWVFSNQIIGLGIIPLLLAIYGLIGFFRKALFWFFLCVFFTLIVLGDNSPLPLGYYIWKLPFFHSMEDMDKYFNFYIMFSIAVMAGLGLEKMRGAFAWGRYAALGFSIVVLTLLTLESSNIYNRAFLSELPKYDSEKEFYFVKRLPTRDKWGFFQEDYLYHLRNIGTIDSYTNIKLPNSVQPRYFIDENLNPSPNPVYKGELYTESGRGKVGIAKRSQNYLEIDVDITQGETLVFNQNYDKYWSASFGEIKNDGSGLLKVYINRGGRYKIVVRNSNKRFLEGCILEVTALIMLYPVGRGFLRMSGRSD